MQIFRAVPFSLKLPNVSDKIALFIASFSSERIRPFPPKSDDDA